MTQELHEAMTLSHSALRDHHDASVAAARGEARCGEIVQKVDAFLIDSCRHLSAFCDIIVPVARKRLPDGNRRVKEYVQQARRLERAVAQTKGRLYGASNAARLPWAQVWSRLGEEFARLSALEEAIIADLAPMIGESYSGALAARFSAARMSGPTRPHPHSPHHGRLGHQTRRVWAKADALWDRAEARIVSGTVKTFKQPARLAIKK